MSLALAFRTAARKAKERNWDKIYVAVDWHDVICESNYSEDGAYGFIEDAIPALQEASHNKAICLILYSCSYIATAEDFMRHCRKKYGINFDYFNCNPEVKNTNYGEFGKKFYYDLLLDDKAGFDASTDWGVFASHMEIFFGDCYE